MNSAPASGLYVFPSDLVDEGPEQVAATASQLGFSHLSLAMAYHQARDVVPHRAGGRIHYRRDGVFFRPDPARWVDSPARPRVQSSAEVAAVDQLIALDERPRVEAWTVFLHNTTLGEEHPSATTTTCFGDRILSNLCPSSPLSRAYALALADDVSARGFDVIAEALSAQTFGHGHHHERSFAPVGPGDEALLGLCFCTHCTSPAEGAGVDVERLAARCRDRVDAAFDGAPGLPAREDALVDAVGEDVRALLQSRTDAVTTLVAQASRAVRAQGRRFVFMDLTGAVLGYDDGLPTGAPAADQAWRLSIEPAAVAAHVDAYTVLGYAQEPDRLGVDVASIRQAIGATELRVILRPGAPDTRSAEHYRAKAAATTAAGADRIDVYNYGMSPSSVLARVR